MKTFQNCAAQGDCMLRRVAALPAGVTPAQPQAGAYVVAHSETGHNHIIDAAPCVRMYDTEDPLVSYLEVLDAAEQTEVLLRHLRGWGTHETLKVPTGIFEIRRQREYVPEGWRRAQD
jgi:hypothetical protein